MDGIYLTHALPKVTWLLSHVLLIIALWVEYPSYHHFTEGVTRRCCHLLKATELLRRRVGKQFSGQHQRLSSQNPRPFPPALSVLMSLRWRPPFPPVLWSSSLCVSRKDLKDRAVAQPQHVRVFVCSPHFSSALLTMSLPLLWELTWWFLWSWSSLHLWKV